MSYSCKMRGCKFRINTEHFGDVLRCLIDDVEKHTVDGRFGEYQDGDAHLPAGVSIEEAKRIAERGGVGAKQDLIFKFLLEEGYSLGFDGKGNINSLRHTKDHWFDDTRFFDLFAKFVEKGSYIEMSGQDGALWRMYFDGEHCHELNAVFTYPGMDDVANDKSFVEEELLAAVENAELGRVYDDIDDLFAYMFNEVDSFNDFVSMLTPELKEAIVFAQEWNGGVVKAFGQYYYSSEFDGNFIADGKTPSFDKYAVAKEVELEDFENALECLGYSAADYSDEVLRDMFDDHYDKLGNDDVYNAIYNETLDEVLKEYEKTNTVTQSSEKMSFIDDLMDGKADFSDIDKYVEYWHTHNTGDTLQVFLGLTDDEMEEWGTSSDSKISIDNIISRAKQTCEEVNNSGEAKVDIGFGKE